VRGRSLADAGSEAAVIIAELEAAEALLGVADDESATTPPPEIAAATEALDAADRAADAGQSEEARRRYLDAARAFAGAGLRDAALDACFDALAVGPDDLELHVTLAELYAAAGWSEHLAAKAALVGRFLDLEPDPAVRERLTGIVEATA
jgi:hypothetical protein